jgi:hypothetical protein
MKIYHLPLLLTCSDDTLKVPGSVAYDNEPPAPKDFNENVVPAGPSSAHAKPIGQNIMADLVVMRCGGRLRPRVPDW